MTIELLEARKIELQKQHAQLVANANAVSGAMQDCDFWIQQLKQSSVASAPTT